MFLEAILGIPEYVTDLELYCCMSSKSIALVMNTGSLAEQVRKENIRKVILEANII